MALDCSGSSMCAIGQGGWLAGAARSHPVADWQVRVLPLQWVCKCMVSALYLWARYRGMLLSCPSHSQPAGAVPRHLIYRPAHSCVVFLVETSPFNIARLHLLYAAACWRCTATSRLRTGTTRFTRSSPRAARQGAGAACRPACTAMVCCHAP